MSLTLCSFSLLQNYLLNLNFAFLTALNYGEKMNIFPSDPWTLANVRYIFLHYTLQSHREPVHRRHMRKPKQPLHPTQRFYHQTFIISLQSHLMSVGDALALPFCVCRSVKTISTFNESYSCTGISESASSLCLSCCHRLSPWFCFRTSVRERLQLSPPPPRLSFLNEMETLIN